ncbi:hypothetical protein EW145_g8036 [Phellinidium pouzarii]|uniref:Uncharacterized protein n=1 Tax=Phellinidium pouzarii TaxID=167371 RepID=A0A4S4KAU8_9AGAM|nr:hypothetical protein EW145_g8036 [Phellinidium pouzarii]
MDSSYILNLCSSTQSIAAELAKDPSQEVLKVVKRLRKQCIQVSSKARSSVENGKGSRGERDRLDRSAECGKFPARPSDLFLKIYADVLQTLHSDPLANTVSPSLIGSSGVIPLTIVSVIPDIMRHYADHICNELI